MNQYREDKAQTRRNNAEYEINKTAAETIAFLHVRLDEMKRDLLGRINANQVSKHDPDPPKN